MQEALQNSNKNAIELIKEFISIEKKLKQRIKELEMKSCKIIEHRSMEGTITELLSNENQYKQRINDLEIDNENLARKNVKFAEDEIE